MPQPLAVDEIASEEQLAAVSVPGSGLVLNGRQVKFFIDRRVPETARVFFINGNFQENGQVPNAAKFHFFFAKRVLNVPENREFNDVTYFTPGEKRYVAGTLQVYTLREGEPPVYGIQFYPQDVIREEQVLDAALRVREKIRIPDVRVAFVPTGSQQTVATVAPRLAEAGIEVLPVDRILGSVTYLPLNPGDAWGFLRIFPRDLEALSATDIPVFDELPLDLSVVAGVITKTVQDASSHVNLKSKERGTPNMVLRDAGPDHPLLARFADQPVHLVVRPDGFTIEASTPEVVAAELAKRRDKPWITLPSDSETRLLAYSEMCPNDPAGCFALASRYGSKASTLGFLMHPQVLGRVRDAGSPSATRGYDLVPAGFGIPQQIYRNLVAYEPNKELRRILGELIAAEKAGTLSGAGRARRVREVQNAFLAAEFPKDDLKRIQERLEEVLPDVEKIKVRSSANAEDIPGFDGAGLHDSFAANPQKKDKGRDVCRLEEEGEGDGEVKRKVKPKTVSCAIKGVYASLWNKRAIEERDLARIDPESVAMGLAIVPAYDLDAEVSANSVVVSRVLGTSDIYGYTLSIQEGNNLVTNPTPGTISEVTIAAFLTADEPVSLTVTRFARPTPAGPVRTEPVLARAQVLDLVEVVRKVEEAWCRAKPGYYDGDCRFVTADVDKPKALDLEFKVVKGAGGDRLVCKQARELGGR
ncbi:MAG TPA: PEP/pyruvate-binding domain-containing protein [Thermoanaerobaculia bacterium]|nr:PEP/pyruvate-binding domain-containing protein [Thermoanaerobaculia bacterium]